MRRALGSCLGEVILSSYLASPGPHSEISAKFMKQIRAKAAERPLEKRIVTMRGERVILDSDLAELYGVSTKRLNEQVRRNLAKFPADFAFQLTAEEAENLKCQIGISIDWGGRRRSLPHAFTEQGVAMLSSVLRSQRAIHVNVAIMRTFVRLRETLSLHKELAYKLAELEGKIANHDESIRTLFEAIRQLMTPPETPRKEIGFHIKENSVPYRFKRKTARQ